MYNFVLTVHIITCVVLIVAILFFQTSKGSALSMFGGGGDALFSSPTGTSFMRKFTIAAAIVFGATSLLLTVFVSSLKMRSVVQEYPLQRAAPAKPGKNTVKPDAGSRSSSKKEPAKPHSPK